MSTHNIHFHGEIRELFCGYSFLSGPMNDIFLTFSFFFTENGV